MHGPLLGVEAPPSPSRTSRPGSERMPRAPPEGGPVAGDDRWPGRARSRRRTAWSRRVSGDRRAASENRGAALFTDTAPRRAPPATGRTCPRSSWKRALTGRPAVLRCAARRAVAVRVSFTPQSRRGRSHLPVAADYSVPRRPLDDGHLLHLDRLVHDPVPGLMDIFRRHDIPVEARSSGSSS